MFEPPPARRTGDAEAGTEPAQGYLLDLTPAVRDQPLPRTGKSPPQAIDNGLWDLFVIPSPGPSLF